MKGFRIALAAAAVLLAAGSWRESGAAVLRVPEDYATIVAAVDAAVSGDSVAVGPGTWTHTETRQVVIGGVARTITACGFLKGGVTVFGRDGRDATIVDAMETGSGFIDTFEFANQTGIVTLSGLTITGAASNGTGVNGDTSTGLVISDCRITNNAGDAVVGFSCPLVILDSEISFNGPGTNSGGAIYAVGGGPNSMTVEIRRCRIEGNSPRGVGISGGVPTKTTITDSEFVDNVGGTGGSGLSVGGAAGVNGEVSGNLFLGNVNNGTTSGGGGMSIASTLGGTFRVRNNLFIQNSAGLGGGLRIFGGNPEIENNTFYACTSTAGGDAVLKNGSSSIGFTANIIAKCSGTWALAWTSGQLTSVAGCNVLWGNQADSFQWPLQPTDFNADPRFCDEANLDFTVQAGSPCASGNTPGCGQIGAEGVGCGTVSVESRSWGAIKGLYRSSEGGSP